MNRIHAWSLPLRAGAVLLSLGLAVAARPAAAQCEAQKLTTADPAAGEADQFGDAVALSGDLAVVGVPRHDFLGSAAGAVYVFRYGLDEGSGEMTWTEEAKLLAADGTGGDLFGWSVAVEDNGPGGAVIVAGASWDDHAGGANAGAAYVFESSFDGAGWTWQQAQKLTTSDADGGDEFGQAVAISGDVIAVGAARDDDGDTNTGSVYVFRRLGATWEEEPDKLVAPDAAAHDQFGTAVAVSGDLVVAGAPLHDHDGHLNSGAAYVFRFSAGSWGLETKLFALDAAPSDQFGRAVAADGAVVLIGSPLDDALAVNGGSAYAFRHDGVTWSNPAKVSAPDAAQDDGFGGGVAVHDGLGDADLAVVGAAGVDGPGAASGGAYLLVYDGIDWVVQPRLAPADNAAGDGFGWSVAMSGAFMIVGANQDDDDGVGENAGSAYVFTVGSDLIFDCNDNGVPDLCDIESGTSADCDENGVPDECDLLVPENDVNENGVLDACEDCNENGTPDLEEIGANPDLDCDVDGVLDVCQIDAASGAPGGPFFCAADCDPDCNGNGVPDACDLADGSEEDCNGNGVPDVCDIAEGTSEDLNGDGIPDDCDSDCNDNGVPDVQDIADGTSADCNENGIPDDCDLDPDDPDGDGSVSDDCDENLVPDECEDCNDNGLGDACDIEAGTSLDLNGNGIPDECEDCDGDSVPDFVEISFDPDLDCNGNGILDACEIDESSGAPGGPYFCTEACDPDCNDNGVPDTCDVANETSADCDANGIPDECDVDCNENGAPDACDIAGGASADANGNGIPDECEDCNGNEVPDDQDIAAGTSADCNGNAVPDECEIPEGSDAPGGPFHCAVGCDPDCNENGIPDACDIADETSPDFNANGIPDECEPDCDDDGLPDFLEILLGLAEDLNGNGVPDECEGDCPADVDGNGAVDFFDLVEVLSTWGPCVGCGADTDGDGLVGFTDLVAVLSAWGVCL